MHQSIRSLFLGSFAVLSTALLVGRAAAQIPDDDRLTISGEFMPGQVVVQKTGTVYALKYRGLTDGVEYQIDVADPGVHGGLVKVYEKYSDSFPIATGGVIFRDYADHLYLPTTLVQYSTLTNEYIAGNSVVLEYTDTPHLSGVHHRRHTYTLTGKALSVTIEDTDHNTAYFSNYMGMYIGPTQGTENARVVQMQGTLVTPIILFQNGARHWYLGATLDFFQSNASDWLMPDPMVLPTGVDSINFSTNTASRYYRNSAGQLSAPLKDTWTCAISQHVRDVFVEPTQPPSPYRELLEHRTVVLLAEESTTWNNYKTHLQQFKNWGMDDIAAYTFDYWTSSATDAPAPGNQGPDWYPARDPSSFTSLAATARAQGIPLAVYTAFATMPATAPSWVYDPSHIARKDTGAYKTSIQLGTPLMATTAAGIHARREAQSLKQAYDLTAGYLDIQSYAAPSHGADGDHLDQTAGSPWARTMRDAFIAQKSWMRDMTDTFAGPLLGEGSIGTYTSNTEWLWAGYCDSVQRVINTGGFVDAAHQPLNDPDSPTLWPVIPEYELRVVAKTQCNHGNGFYARFFSRSDTGMTSQSTGLPNYPLSEAALDRYRLYEITYGKTSFFETNGQYNGLGNMLRFADMLKEYYMVRALQSRYLDSPVQTIKYMYQGALWNFDHIIAQTETTDTFRDPKIRMTYTNGLEVYVNHSTTNWVVTVGGVLYTIPQDGFVAYQPAAPAPFLAFSAIPPTTGGKRIDYCYAPGEYECFDGRGQVGSYGNINTGTVKRLEVQNFVRGLNVQELTDGSIQVNNGAAPSVVSVDIIAPANLVPTQRATAKAVAHYNNGAFRDVTTLVHWNSSNTGVATINDGGALIGVTPGQISLSTTAFQGVTPTAQSIDVN